MLARGVEVIKCYGNDSDGDLYDALVESLRGVSELPGEEYYHLLAAWVMHTYLLEWCQYSPILYFFAVPERGKSRTGKALSNLSRRGFRTETLNEAFLFRLADRFQATICFDVMDLSKKAERKGSEDLLLNRYERGGKAARVNPDQPPNKDILFYDLFGPTIIASNEPIDSILETRALQIIMPDAARDFSQDVLPEDARPLKERLTAFRARHLLDSKPQIEKPVRGRLGDILRPIMQITLTVKPKLQETILGLTYAIEKQRCTEKGEGIDAEILDAIMKLRQADQAKSIPLKDIAKVVNEGRLDTDHIHPQQVGYRLKAMGFRKERKGSGVQLIWNQSLFGRLAIRHGLHQPTDPADPAKPS
jgi:hypothetical protein